jgi:hypothetical protein
MNFLIDPQTLEDLLNYLAKRPWMEVQQLIAKLSNLEKEPEDKVEKPTKTTK